MDLDNELLSPAVLEDLKILQTELAQIDLGPEDRLHAALKVKMDAYAEVFYLNSAPELVSFLEALTCRMYSIARKHGLQWSLNANLRVPNQTGSQGSNDWPIIEVQSHSKEKISAESAEGRGISDSLRTLLVMTSHEDDKGYRPRKLAVKWMAPDPGEPYISEGWETPGGGETAKWVAPEPEPDQILGRVKHEEGNSSCFDLLKYLRYNRENVIPLGEFSSPNTTLLGREFFEQMRLLNRTMGKMLL
ncbi:hypothetical protein HD806DRAFT_369357 [Xylariaceae sp. AK1471]|nr:hypothetical protein HD806DRAFT_369357 [Xylariaceae sp. AK1471]